MQTRISGEFTHKGYKGLIEESTETSLYDVIATTFPLGSIVSLDVTATLVGQKPLCLAENKYGGKCRTVLEDDGSCTSSDSHKPVAVPMELPL